MTKAVRLNVDNKKKLISATAMLLISALMLGISTFAWFTMSKELEVKGIGMSAATPDDVQISLGKLNGDGVLADNTGTLDLTGTDVTAPTDNDTDWANVANVDSYYKFGRLFPASSTNGVNLYATGDASGIGRTVKSNAVFYQVNDLNDDDTPTASSFMATTYRKGQENWATWTGTRATGYRVTKDDGYYVDIPVWFRATKATNLKVQGYVTKFNGSLATSGDTDELYQAARVAILTDAKAVEGGLVNLKDYNSFDSGLSGAQSIIDSKNYNDRTDGATSGTVYGVSAATPSWAAATVNTTPNAVVTLEAPSDPSTNRYGEKVKKIIRVWLEGEDKNCYNANANQDFKIALKFY